MASRANQYYRLLVAWANPALAQREDRHEAFAFGDVQQWDRSLMNAPGEGV